MPAEKIPTNELEEFQEWWRGKYGYTAKPPDWIGNAYRQWSIEEGPLSKQVTPYAKRILGERLPEYYPEAAAWAAREPLVGVERVAEEAEAIREAEVEIEEEAVVPPFPTEAPPEGYRWELNELNRWVPVFDPYAMTEFQREQLEEPGMTEAERAELAFARQQEEARAEEARRAFLLQQQQQQWQQQQAQQQYGLQQQEAQQQQQYQAWQQEEAQRQYAAQLGAQPQSWLQYAAYTGEQPAIQPWMQPLMPEQYAGLGAGAAIPGWQAQAGQMGVQGMAQLPELTRPSRQYQARMGPTALAQYGGYQQAQTGIRPEELQFRLWSAAPPGGQYQGLRYAR